jgi:hypothetical protein
MERAYRNFRPQANSTEIVGFQKQVMTNMVNIESSFTPYYSQIAYRSLNERLGVYDPYREIKSYYNKTVEKFVPKLQEQLSNASDPVLLAISLAILGNTIDFASNHKIDLENDLANFDLEHDLIINDYPDFLAHLGNAQTILLIGDNAGEIVLDRLLIETLKGKYPEKRFVYAVRGGPAINDATIEDANEVGFPMVCEVVEGSSCPGVILEQASPRFKDVFFNEADLIISKGQGNFESLDDDLGTKGAIFFCLKLKCAVSAQAFNKPLGSLVFCNRHRYEKIL